MRLTCFHCMLPILKGQKYVNFKLPLTDGTWEGFYENYHNRWKDDCYEAKIREIRAELRKLDELDKALIEQKQMEMRRGYEPTG